MADDLNGAGIIYSMVTAYHPEDGQAYLDWLDQGHMIEVCQEPGVLWARRVKLDQPDEADGWPRVLLLYGMKDREALEAYLVCPARDRFWKQVEELARVHRSERFWGDIDYSVN